MSLLPRLALFHALIGEKSKEMNIRLIEIISLESRHHDGELYLGNIWSDGVKVLISHEAGQFSLEKTDSHVIVYYVLFIVIKMYSTLQTPFASYRMSQDPNLSVSCPT